MTCIDKAWLEAHQEFVIRHANIMPHPDRAHPYPPGSGPRGQTCGTCAKLCARHFSKTYFKCRVLMKFWSGGKGTDIRKKDPACRSWEPRIDTVEPISTIERCQAGWFPGEDSPMSRRRRIHVTAAA